MPLVGDAQMAALRAVANNGLVTPVTITRPTQVETDFGSVEQWTTVATTTGWLREMKTSTVGTDVYLIAAVSMFRLHLAYGTDIDIGDRVEAEGVTYEVNDTNAGSTLRIYTTAVLRIVQ